MTAGSPMNHRRRSFVASLVALALVACSQPNAPADKTGNSVDSKLDEPKPAAIETAAPAKVVKGAFAPRDECTDIPGAAAFSRQLAAAVAARDADKLVALAAPDVRLDFGGGAGTTELRARLAEQDRNLWGELDALTQLGCSANAQDSMTLPWLFDQDFGHRDPMMTMIVVGEDVPTYISDDEGAAPSGALSWDAVELVEGLTPGRLQKVTTGDGKTVFIATDRLRSVIDYRLTALRRDGQWRFTSLIAGD